MGKRPTIADVAARAGVSPTAVSLVLNDRPGSRLSPEAAARIRQAAEELDYRPNPAARSMRLGKTRTVGFISDDVTITRFASAMIRGALDVARNRQHTVLIAETGSHPARRKESVRAILDRNPDGLVFAAMGAKEIGVPAVVGDVPVVMVNATSPDGRPSVLPDEHSAGRAVANQLLAAGHRRIALIGYSDELRAPRMSVTVGHRYDGMFQAFAEAGVELTARVVGRVWEPDFGYDALVGLLTRHSDLTGVICANDRIAFGVYQALQESGLRIPDDISVVSFDDDEIASYLRPGLTTAAIPYERMGREAMELVLDQPTSGGHLLVPMPLRVRGSVQSVEAAAVTA